MKIAKFKKNYFFELNNLINNFKTDNDFSLLIQRINNVKKKKGTIHLFGNGGSQATVTHFANDMTKNAKIKSVVYTDSSLNSCFNNDYGFENSLSKIAEYFVNYKKDLIIVLSVSGNSKNLVNLVSCMKKHNTIVDLYNLYIFK